jgi:hypothetical protein
MVRLGKTVMAGALAFLPACGSGPGSAPASSPPREPAPAELFAGLPLVRPSRYLASDATWIERAEGGIDRVVVNGRRMEVRGAEIVRLGPLGPELRGGAAAPAWADSGPTRYVFWSGREVFGAERWDGELRRLGTLPSEPRRAFDWVDGVGLVLDGGAVVARAVGGTPVMLPVGLVVDALAVDARRALAVTVLGRAALTVDGGASFRDVTAELGQILAIEARGEALAVALRDGRTRVLGADSRFADARGFVGPLRGKPAEADADLWPDGGSGGALAAAVRSGLPLPDGGAVITARGFVGRLDLASLRTTQIASLARVAPEADCAPFRAADAVLLACASESRASLVDVSGAPRLERSFDLTKAPAMDRFLGADGEAIGFLGPCDGSAPRPSPGALLDGSEDYDVSTSRSAIFCVREGRDAWVEHRLTGADATEVVAWIPRAHGGAVALVARRGMTLPDRDRVSIDGALRVVRVARDEPPLALPAYGFRGPELLSRTLRARPDGTIEGFLPAAVGMLSATGVVFDAAGRVRAFTGPPNANQIVMAGMSALTQTDEGKLFETTSGGQRWFEVAPPPATSVLFPSDCSPVGCQIGPFVRLGWSGAADPVASSADAKEGSLGRFPSRLSRRTLRGRYGRPPLAPPVARLVCAFDGPAEGKHAADSFGFGFVPGVKPRASMALRLAGFGVVTIPSGGLQVAPTGDAEIAWVAPLDLSGKIQRVETPLAQSGLGPQGFRGREIKLAYVLDPSSGLDAIATRSRESCIAGMLDAAGVTRPVGGCAEEPSVGVDVGGRLFTLNPRSDALVVSVAEGARRRRPKEGPARPRAPAEADPAKLPVALHDLARSPLGGPSEGFMFGAGARAGAPVAVVVDVHGKASLAAIDPTSGALGAEEPLAPLTALALGGEAACTFARAGEARVVLPFTSAIGLDPAALPGVLSTGLTGVSVLRWSKERACLDAVELSVRDERYDVESNEMAGVLRKLTARFDTAGTRGRGTAALLLVTHGTEVRQPLACTRVLPGPTPSQY